MFNKFYPKSPDSSVINDPDQGLVKFGHINKVIDLING